MSSTCPACAADISSDSRYCPRCGKAVSRDLDVTVSATGQPVQAHVTSPTAQAREDSPAAAERNSLDSSSDVSLHGRFVPGTRVADRYRIVALLGRGGMGEVYRADDLKLGQPVALKFLPGLGADGARLDMFLNEVRLSRQVAHPNVCRVYDVGEIDGQHFLSMEYIDGEDLKGLLKRIGRLPKAKGVEIAQQLCAGLAAAHDMGVVHRDLKPANIMIDGRGHVRITDFGLAAIVDDAAASNKTAGTPAYMAPEQLAEGTTSIQSDLYSLGLILYEVFTGTRVHKGTTIAELRREHEQSSPTHPSAVVDDMDPAVERVIMRCLDRLPQERPLSARAVAAALPGGDPLAAALAAGETPSPEMIAAAGGAAGLSLRAGASLFAVVCVILLALPFLTDQLQRLNLREYREITPAVLEDNAKMWIAKLAGPIPAAGDVESKPPVTQEPIDHASGMSSAPVKNAQGNVVGMRLSYWYRQRDSALVPFADVFSSAHEWDVDYINPTPMRPGMTSIRLDAAERRGSGKQLLEYIAVPRDDDAERAPAPATRTASDFLAAIGVSDKDYTQVKPVDAIIDWRPPIAADHVTVWQRNDSDPIEQVVIATRGDTIVYARRSSSFGSAMDMLRRVDPKKFNFHTPLAIATVLFAGVLAMINVFRGRSDTRGAMRCALYYFIIHLALYPLVFHVSGNARHLFETLADHLFRSMAYALRLWIYYVALEPYVRRIWPHMMISWSRVLAGRIRDPLIGRDALVGCLYAVVIMVLTLLCRPDRNFSGLDVLTGSKGVWAIFPSAHLGALLWGGLANLAMLTFLRFIVRRDWLTGVLHVAITTTVTACTLGSSTNPPLEWLSFAIWATCLVILFFRFGLLCVVIGHSLFAALLSVPMSADLGAWYARPTPVLIAFVLIVAGLGFYTSTLAGRRRKAAVVAT